MAWTRWRGEFPLLFLALCCHGAGNAVVSRDVPPRRNHLSAGIRSGSAYSLPVVLGGERRLLSNAANCSSCPAGQYCASDGVCVSCSRGSYKEGTGNDTHCVLCSAGTYSNTQGAMNSTACQACPDKSTSGEGAGICGCVEGLYMQEGVCQGCPAGTFSTAYNATSSDTCLPCPAGTWSDGVGLASSSLCEACPEGTYSAHEGASSSSFCAACPLYSSSPQGAASLLECVCLEGYSSAQAGTLCIPCVEGTYCSNGTLSLCPHNSGSRALSSSLSNCTCNPGYSGEGGACAACPAGYWKGASGPEACTACPAGTYSVFDGATEETFCFQCPANSNSSAGSGSVSGCVCDVGYSGSDGGPCLTCQAGFFKNASGNASCAECPEGTFSASIASGSPSLCLSCPTNTYSVPASVYAFQCVCAAGYTGDASSCAECPGGYYKDAPGSFACTPCAAGTFLNATAGTSAADCAACPNASHSGAGSALLADCACNAGFTGSGGACEACPSGKFKGSWGGAACQNCPEGTYSDEDGASSCRGCPDANQDSPEGSNSSAECRCNQGYNGVNGGSCTPCSAGTYWVSNSTAGYCVACALGKYLVDEGVVGDQCAECPANTNTSGEGSSALSDCVCEAGHAGSDGKACSECPAGSFKSQAGSGECEACGADSFSVALAAFNQTVCSACGADAQSLAGSGEAEACTCNAGFTGPDGGNCTACAVGAYKPTKGPYPCTACQRGKYSAAAAATDESTCTDCRAHSLSDPGSGNLSECLCNAGYWQNDTAGACEVCEVGTYKGWRGDAACSGCPSGASTRRQASLSAEQCVCGAGLYGSLGGECALCLAGYYCPGDGAKRACPFYSSSAPGGSSAGDCVCSPGYYGPNGGECLLCPRDSYCTGGTSATPCPGSDVSGFGSNASSDCSAPSGGGAGGCLSGTYLSGGSCLECPPNLYCPGGTDAPVVCPNNSHSAAGMPSGEACFCDSGWYGTPGEACAACEAGSYCSLSLRHACPVNAISEAGSSTVSACYCADGYEGDNGTACVPCQSGTWCASFGTLSLCHADSDSPDMSTSAEHCVCDPGFSGPDGGPACSQCAPGTYKESNGSATCTACAAGTWGWLYRAEGPSACVACPRYAWSPEGSSSELECLCLQGYEGSDGGPCAPCAAGTWKDRNGSSPCSPCPAGTFSDSLAAPSNATCAECPTGSSSPEGSDAVTRCTCIAGWTGKDGEACSQCAAGTFKTRAGSQACSCCGANTYSETQGQNDSATCLACPGNATSPKCSGSAATCVCKRGYTGSDGGPCLGCPGGFFKPTKGSSNCTECGVGTYSTEASTACASCPANSHSAAGSDGIASCKCNAGYTGPDGGPCTACEAGTWKGDAGFAACTPCAVGTWSFPTAFGSTVEADACQACAFFSSSAAGSVLFTSCVCNPGYTGRDGSPCTPCPAGSYKAANGSSACTGCLAGTYSNASAATSASTCVGCHQNSSSLYFSDEQADCRCSAGFTGPDGGPECPQCAAGTYKFWVGSQACAKCRAGSYSTEVGATWSDICVACPANTYSLSGSGSVDECKANMGYWMDGSVVTVCPVGTYKETSLNNSFCTYCHEGATTLQAGRVSAGQCLCDLGHFLEGSSVCSQCALGSYKDSLGPDACAKCPSGSGTLSIGRRLLAECTCNAGYTGQDGEACAACPAGSFKNETGNATCAGFCPNNTYSTVVAATSASVCLDCDINAQSGEGSGGPADCRCNLGYTGSNGGTCAACQAGRYKDTVGPSSCIQCAEGTYSGGVAEVAESACLACPSSNSSSVVGSTHVDNCTCNKGYTGPNGGNCTACPTGTYKGVVGPSECVMCPVGTYGDAEAMSACTDCPQYFYSRGTNYTAAADCEVNLFINASINQSNPLAGASNTLTVSLVTNIDIPHGLSPATRITVKGLDGATADAVSIVSLRGGANEVFSGTLSAGRLVLSIRSGQTVASGTSYVFQVEVQNPFTAQDAPAVAVRADGRISIDDLPMVQPDTDALQVPNGTNAMLVVVPSFEARRSIEQSNPLASVRNVLTVTLQGNVRIAMNSTVTIRGLVGSQGSGSSLDLAQSPADAFSSPASWDAAAGKLVLNVSATDGLDRDVAYTVAVTLVNQDVTQQPGPAVQVLASVEAGAHDAPIAAADMVQPGASLRGVANGSNAMTIVSPGFDVRTVGQTNPLVSQYSNVSLVLQPRVDCSVGSVVTVDGLTETQTADASSLPIASTSDVLGASADWVQGTGTLTMEVAAQMSAGETYNVTFQLHNPSEPQEAPARAPAVQLTVNNSDDDSAGPAANLTQLDGDALGIAFGQKVLYVVEPQFETAVIQQSTPLTNAVNVLTLTLKTNCDLAEGSAVTIAGLVSTQTATNSSLPVTSNPSGAFAETGRWVQERGELVLSVASGGAPSNVTYILALSLQNPLSGQGSPDVNASGHVQGDPSNPTILPVNLSKVDKPLLGIASGEHPLLVVEPAFSTKQIGQTTPLASASNLLRVTLQANVDIAAGSLVTLEGLVETTTSDSASLALVSSPEHYFGETALWSKSTGVLVATVNRTLLRTDTYVLEFELTNLDTEQDSVAVNISGVVEAGSVDSPLPTASVTVSGEDALGVANGSSPLLVVVPIFVTGSIAQSFPYAYASNTIAVTLQSNADMSPGSFVTVAGLTDTLTGSTSALPVSSASGAFGSTATWDQSSGNLVVNVTETVLASSSHVVFFTLRNPGTPQRSPAVIISAVIENGASDATIAPTALETFDTAVLGVANGSHPLEVVQPRIVTEADASWISQANPLAGASNTLSVVVQFDHVMPTGSAIEVSGLTNTQTADNTSISVYGANGGAFGEQVSWVQGNGTLRFLSLSLLEANKAYNFTFELRNHHATQQAVVAVVSAHAEAGEFDSPLKAAELAQVYDSSYGVLNGTRPMLVIEPVFESTGIGQSNPLAGANNTLTVTLSVNFDFSVDSTVTLSGLTGTQASHSLQELTSTGGVFAAGAQWAAEGVLVLTVKNDTAATSVASTVVSLDVQNANTGQASPTIRAEATVESGGFDPRVPAVTVTPSSSVILGLTDGGKPLFILEPSFSVRAVSQSMALVNLSNTITVSLTANFDMPDESTVTISGLTGIKTASDTSMPIDYMPGSSVFGASGLWDIAGTLALTVCCGRNTSSGAVLNFTVVNGPSEVSSRDVRASFSVGGGYGVSVSDETASLGVYTDFGLQLTTLGLIVPTFTTKAISQSSPLAGSGNTLRVTLEANLDLPDGSTVTLRGLSGTQTASNGLLPISTVSGPAVYGAAGVWDAGGSLVLTVCCGLNTSSGTVITFDVVNGDVGQGARSVELDFHIGGGVNHAVSGLSVESSTGSVLGVSGGAGALKIIVAGFAELLMGQSNPIVNGSNTLTVTLGLNLDLPDGSTVTVSGLSGMATGSNGTLGVSTVSGPAVYGSSGGWDVGSGTLVLTVCCGHATSAGTVVSFVLVNGGSAVGSRDVRAGFFVGGGYGVSGSGLGVEQSAFEGLGLNVTSMGTYLANVSVGVIGQSNALAGGVNTLTVTLGLNLDLPDGSTVTVSGLSGMATGSNGTLGVSTVSGPAVYGSSGGWDVGSGTLVLTVCCGHATSTVSSVSFVLLNWDLALSKRDVSVDFYVGGGYNVAVGKVRIFHVLYTFFGLSLPDLGLIIPVIATRRIGQSTPLAGATNALTVTLQANLDLPDGSTVTLSGLSGTKSGTSTLSLSYLTGPSAYGSSGAWESGGTFVLTVCCGLSTSSQVVLSFNVVNGDFAQQAPSVSLSFDISGHFGVAAEAVTQSTSLLVGVTNGAAALKIIAPAWEVSSMAQSNPLVNGSNTLTVSLSTNIALTLNSKVTLSGLENSTTASTPELAITHLSGLAVFGSSADWNSSGILTLNVSSIPPLANESIVFSFVLSNALTPQSSSAVFASAALFYTEFPVPIAPVPVSFLHQELWAVANGTDPLLCVLPVFVSFWLNQTSHVAATHNNLTLLVTTNVDLVSGSVLTVSGLSGAHFEGETIALFAVSGGNSGHLLFESQGVGLGTSRASGEAVYLTVAHGALLLAHTQYLLTFQLENPPHIQTAPDVLLDGSVGSSRFTRVVVSGPSSETGDQGNASPMFTVCPLGQYGAFGWSSCLPCWAGTYSGPIETRNTLTCLPCPGNHTSSPPGSSVAGNCTCVRGYTAHTNGAECLPCNASTYKDTNGTGLCAPCPGNATSPPASPSLASCLCLPGFEGDDGGACIACPPHTAKATVGPDASDCGASSCIYAAPLAGAVPQCLACPAGRECADGACANCTACAAGSHKDAPGVHDCEPCPANTYSGAVGAASAAACAACPEYHSSPTGSTSPDNCTLACPSRYYQLPNGSCWTCPLGAVCGNKSTCALRSDPPTCGGSQGVVGVWARREDGVALLLACPSGHELLNATEPEGVFSHDAQRCRKCKDCEYNADPLSFRCQPCSRGMVCSGNETVGFATEGSEWELVGGVWLLRRCPEGHFLYNGTTGNGTVGWGHFVASSQECVPCPAGSECPGGGCEGGCAACGPGTYKDWKGKHKCTLCPANSYANWTGSDSAGACRPCPDHATTLGREGRTMPEECACMPHLYLAVATDGSGAVECAACPVGAACPSNGSCALHTGNYGSCPGGDPAPLGAWERLASGRYSVGGCPEGHFTVRSPHHLQACEPCPEGEYVLDPASAGCQACPPGLVCRGGVVVGVALAGSEWENAGAVRVLTRCPEGYGLHNGSGGEFQPSEQWCAPCGEGTDCRAGGCSAGCLPCAPGWFKEGKGVHACTPCPPSTYSPRKGAAACSPCPEGSGTLSGGLASAAQCACAAGLYTVSGNGSILACSPNCPVGAVCYGDAFECALALPDLSCSTTGPIVGTWERVLGGEYALTGCPEGHERAAGSHLAQHCRPCPQGYYVLDPAADQCQPCPEGLSCPGGGAFTPRTAGAAWSGVGGVLTLTRCPAGYYLHRGAHHQSQQCLPCPEGTECPGGGCEGTAGCAACPAGTYKEVPSSGGCAQCPAGTHSATVGATMRSVCAACVEGATTQGGGHSSAKSCSCTGGTYPIFGMDGSASCEACPVGALCADGSCALSLLAPESPSCPDAVAGANGTASALGTWSRGGNDRFVLQGCGEGHVRRGFPDVPLEKQECFACASISHFLSPTTGECEPLPEGLLVGAGGGVTPLLAGSSWALQGGSWALLSCPAGHSVYGGGGNPLEQDCVPCGKGLHCPSPPCTACSTCSPGTFKDWVGSEACAPCPADSYAPGAGTDAPCQACPDGSSTNGATGADAATACVCPDTGYTIPATGACTPCPLGAVCPGDGTCALGRTGLECTVGPQVLGTWVQGADGLFDLTGCPAGHERLEEACEPCKTCGEGGGWCREAEYVVDPTRHQCQACPVGAECDGTSLRSPGGLEALGMRWELDDAVGRYWLRQCPAGYRLVNHLGYAGQRCEACPQGGYYVASSTEPGLPCLPCPPSAFCPMGGPPVLVESLSLSLSLHGMDPQSLTAPGRPEAGILLRQVASAGGFDLSMLELTEVCEGDGGACAEPAVRSVPGRRALAPPDGVPGRRQGAAADPAVCVLPAALVKFLLHFRADADPPPDTALAEAEAAVASRDFASVLQGSLGPAMSAANHTVCALPAGSAPERAGPEGWEYEIRVKGNRTVAALIDCPRGYLLVNTTVETQYCKRCPQGSYSFDPLDDCGPASCGERDCPPCPAGATCCGGDAFRPSDPADNTTWRNEQLVLTPGNRFATVRRIVRCPQGYVLVRSEGAPEGDRCLACPPYRYSRDRPDWDTRSQVHENETAALADETICQPCPSHATCFGRADVTPLAGYWLGPDKICPESACVDGTCDPRACFPLTTEGGGEAAAAARRVLASPRGAWGQRRQAPEGVCTDADPCRVRPTVHVCPAGQCLPGGECSEGSTGPACGECVEGWAKEGTMCRRCAEDAASRQAVVYAILGLLIAVGWYYVSWKPLVGGRTMRLLEPLAPLHRRMVRGSYLYKSALGNLMRARLVPLFKITVSYYQVTSNYPRVFNLHWPENLATLMQVIRSVTEVNVLGLPSFTCLASGVTYASKLLLATLYPVGVAVCLCLPPVVAVALGFLGKEGALGHPRLRATTDRAGNAICFLLFVVYPAVSIQVIQTFRCDEELGLLHADYGEVCPFLDPGGFNFTFAVICTLAYPVGIPALMYGILRWYRVPEIATRKVRDSMLESLVARLQRDHSSPESDTLVKLIGNIPAGEEREGLFQQRCHELFEQIDADGSGSLDASELVESFRLMGIANPDEELAGMLVREYGTPSGASGEPAILERSFVHVIRHICRVHYLFTGFETFEGLTREQLAALCNHDWDLCVRHHHMSKHQHGLEAQREADVPLTALRTPGTAGSRRASGLSTSSGALRRLASGLATPGGGDPPQHGRGGVGLGFAQLHVDPKAEPQEGEEDAARAHVVRVAQRLHDVGAIAFPVVEWSGAEDQAQEDERLAIARIGVLFQAYKAKYWWYELYHMSKKLFMTSILSFVSYGTSLQLYAGFTFLAGQIVEVVRLEPYGHYEHNNYFIYSLLVQNVVLLYGICIKVDAASPTPVGFRESWLADFILLAYSTVFLFPLVTALWYKNVLTKLSAAAYFRMFPVREGEDDQEFEEIASPATALLTAKRTARAANGKAPKRFLGDDPSPQKGRGGGTPGALAEAREGRKARARVVNRAQRCRAPAHPAGAAAPRRRAKSLGDLAEGTGTPPVGLDAAEPAAEQGTGVGMAEPFMRTVELKMPKKHAIQADGGHPGGVLLDDGVFSPNRGFRTKGQELARVASARLFGTGNTPLFGNRRGPAAFLGDDEVGATPHSAGALPVEASDRALLGTVEECVLSPGGGIRRPALARVATSRMMGSNNTPLFGNRRRFNPAAFLGAAEEGAGLSVDIPPTSASSRGGAPTAASVVARGEAALPSSSSGGGSAGRVPDFDAIVSPQRGIVRGTRPALARVATSRMMGSNNTPLFGNRRRFNPAAFLGAAEEGADGGAPQQPPSAQPPRGSPEELILSPTRRTVNTFERLAAGEGSEAGGSGSAGSFETKHPQDSAILQTASAVRGRVGHSGAPLYFGEEPSPGEGDEGNVLGGVLAGGTPSPGSSVEAIVIPSPTGLPTRGSAGSGPTPLAPISEGSAAGSSLLLLHQMGVDTPASAAPPSPGGAWKTPRGNEGEGEASSAALGQWARQPQQSIPLIIAEPAGEHSSAPLLPASSPPAPSPSWGAAQVSSPGRYILPRKPSHRSAATIPRTSSPPSSPIRALHGTSPPRAAPSVEGLQRAGSRRLSGGGAAAASYVPALAVASPPRWAQVGGSSQSPPSAPALGAGAGVASPLRRAPSMIPSAVRSSASLRGGSIQGVEGVEGFGAAGGRGGGGSAQPGGVNEAVSVMGEVLMVGGRYPDQRVSAEAGSIADLLRAPGGKKKHGRLGKGQVGRC